MRTQSNGLKNELDREGTRSISKTLAILASFTDTAPQQRTTDIAAKLGLSVSTVSRHLGALLDWGFLVRDDLTGYYRPGSQVITLAGIALQNNPIYRHAFSELQELTNSLHVHGHMAVPHGTCIQHLISLDSVGSQELIPMGYLQPMYCSAIGRAILAHMPLSKVQEILRKTDLVKRTEETKTNVNEILDELERVRRRGYCLLVNELNEGRSSLAVPIFDQQGNPVAGVSVSTTTGRLGEPRTEEQFSQAVKKVGKTISGSLGYYPR